MEDLEPQSSRPVEKDEPEANSEDEDWCVKTHVARLFARAKLLEVRESKRAPVWVLSYERNPHVSQPSSNRAVTPG